MAASQPPLTLIVAATLKNGIGKNGGLPWPMLKQEMAYFARVTKRVPPQTQADQAPETSSSSAQPEATSSEPRPPPPRSQKSPRNAVIMGRKTWDSIPPKFRPLKDRTNVVITRQGGAASANIANADDDNVLIASSIEAGIEALVARSASGRPLGRVFVIGGASIYEQALRLPNARSVLLTRIADRYECDTFFPLELGGSNGSGGGWEERSEEELRLFTGETGLADVSIREKSAGGEVVGYRFMLFQRAGGD